MCTKLVIVDTNCFVRLYFSSLRPLLAVDVAGHRLVTLRELAGETKAGRGLSVRHPWLSEASVQSDLDAAVLPLSSAEDRAYDEDAAYYRRQGDEYLREYCAQRSLPHLRQLSHADAKALAVALDRSYPLATDEWPLRSFAEFVEPDENGQRITLFSSLGLLRLFLSAGRLDLPEVRAIVRSWLMSGERLLRQWRDEYGELFQDNPPTAQG